MNPAAKATPAQVQLIKMGQRALGIDDETYRDTLFVRYQVGSSKDLIQEQVADLLDDYKDRGFVPLQSDSRSRKRQKQGYPSRPRQNGGKFIAMATRDEIDKINQIAVLIAWRAENGLALFLDKRMGIKDGKVRTSADAYHAIEGLKKMFENSMKKQHGPHWWLVKFENPRIKEYIALHKPAEYR